jgi:hypothetical protein
VSLESSSVCVVDGGGRIIREAKVSSEPEALIAWFSGLAFNLARIGLEAGPLSQWLYAGMLEAGLTVELLETRHVRDAFKAMPVKTDRKENLAHIDTPCHVWTDPRIQEQSESDGQVDCDHVSGLTRRDHAGNGLVNVCRGCICGEDRRNDHGAEDRPQRTASRISQVVLYS